MVAGGTVGKFVPMRIFSACFATSTGVPSFEMMGDMEVIMHYMMMTPLALDYSTGKGRRGSRVDHA